MRKRSAISTYPPTPIQSYIMSTLLHVDSSPLFEKSISRTLAAEFVRVWREKNPLGRVSRRDLVSLDIPPIDASWIESAFLDPALRSTSQQASLALSDQLIAELIEADEIVIGVPMHNFSPPAKFKLWIDQIVRVGKTYAQKDGKRVGLLSGKTVHAFVASGGMYLADSPTEKFDFVSPYLHTVFSYMGIDKVHVHSAGGTAAMLFGNVSRDAFLQPHIAAIDAS